MLTSILGSFFISKHCKNILRYVCYFDGCHSEAGEITSAVTV